MTTALPDLGPEAKTSGEGSHSNGENVVRTVKNTLTDPEHEPCSPSESRESSSNQDSGRLCCKLTIQCPRRSWAENQMGNPGYYASPAMCFATERGRG